MNKMKIRVHEANSASLKNLIYDDKNHTLLAEFGNPGDASRCCTILLDELFDNGSLAQYETVQCFPIMSNVAVFMFDKEGADAVNDYILQNFGE